MVHVFDPSVVGGAGDRHEVEHRQVLHHFAQTDAAGMRTDRNAELGGQQQDGEVLVDPADAARVDLQDVDRAGLQHLLEDHPVLDMFAGCDQRRPDGGADRCVAEDVVGRRRLLDPVGREGSELGHPFDGPIDTPSLVGVDGDPSTFAGCVAGHLHATYVGIDVRADLELQHGETVGNRLANKAGNLVVVVAKPTGRGRVRGQAVGLECHNPRRLSALHLTEDRQRVGWREGVVDVGEVDLMDNLFRCQRHEQTPQRNLFDPAAQVPHGIHHCPDRHVHHALLGAEPTELTVPCQLTSEHSDVGKQLADVSADDVRRECAHGCAGDVVAASGGEEQRVAGDVGVVEAEYYVRRRVVGLGVHRVGPVQAERGREPNVDDIERADAGHGSP